MGRFDTQYFGDILRINRRLLEEAHIQNFTAINLYLKTVKNFCLTLEPTPLIRISSKSLKFSSDDNYFLFRQNFHCEVVSKWRVQLLSHWSPHHYWLCFGSADSWWTVPVGQPPALNGLLTRAAAHLQELENNCIALADIYWNFRNKFNNYFVKNTVYLHFITV